jgi:hypothetical protein
MAEWEKALRAVAERPGVVAKVSGLQLAGQPFTTDALREVWDIALDAFGPARLMYGGDWPMTVPAGGYTPHWQVVRALVGELGESVVLQHPSGQRRVEGVDVHQRDLDQVEAGIPRPLDRATQAGPVEGAGEHQCMRADEHDPSSPRTSVVRS